MTDREGRVPLDCPVETCVSSRRDATSVVLSTPARELRKELRPLVWVTLEEVALEAVAENERLVARTSARLVADRLGVDPGTAAGALRDLRRRGLLSFERESGPAGRFGLSVYVLGDISGLRVLSPCPEWPCVAAPVRERPLTEISNLAPACTHESSMEGPSAAAPLSRQPSTVRGAPSPSPSSLQRPGQQALDLRWASS